MLTFDLDVYYGDAVSDVDGDTHIRDIAANLGATLREFTLQGPAGGNPNYVFEVTDEDTAFALVHRRIQ
jgi:hypothetical protein